MASSARPRSLPLRRRSYVFSQMDGPHTDLPQFLINSHRVDDAGDMNAYVARIRESARALDQALERARLNAGEGVRPPRFAYDAMILQARAIVAGAPFPVRATRRSGPTRKQDRRAGCERQGRAARPPTAAHSARAALAERLGPSYNALIAWVEADQASSDEIAAGVWKLPDGAALYTSGSPPRRRRHERGPDPRDRLARSRAHHRQRWTRRNGSASRAACRSSLTFLRSDARFYFPNDDSGREAYLRVGADHLDVIRRRLPDYFGLLPKADLVVKRVEAFREQPGAAQHYFAGHTDGSRPGVYYAHLIDMNAMPKPSCESIAYHEGFPAITSRFRSRRSSRAPDVSHARVLHGIRRRLGVYAERLAKEMGAYGDPYSDFGRLGGELWRAIRLVVDTGLHAKGWTEATSRGVLHRELADGRGPDTLGDPALHRVAGPGDGVQGRRC